MKMRKVISFATAAVLSIASLPILSVGAVDSTNYLLGDLDGDGRITGHDSAMLSNVLYNSHAKPLSELQMFLADTDQDGRITLEDLNAIHAKEESKIGCFRFDDSEETGFSYTDEPTIDAAYLAVCMDSYEAIEYESVICNDEEFPKGERAPFYVDENSKQFFIREEVAVLLDVTGDGRVMLIDACCILLSSSKIGCNLGGMYPSENRFDLTADAGVSEDNWEKAKEMETQYSGMTQEEFHAYVHYLNDKYIEPNVDDSFGNNPFCKCD